MIRNIIFDIGNVLGGFTWREYYQSFGFDEKTLQRLASATVHSRFWRELDRGEISTEEAICGFQEIDPSLSAEIEMVFADISGMICKYDYACTWIGELKEKGYKVYIISNISEIVLRDCRNALTFLELVDGAILSCRERLLKPEEGIYRLLLERYCLKSVECVFLDDLEHNTSAAEKMGIRSVLFMGYEQGKKALEDILK